MNMIKDFPLSQNQEKGIFYTASLNLVAYLITKGRNYVEIKKYKGSSLFGFESTSDLDDAIREYKNDRKIQSFISEMRKVKSVIKNI